MSSTRRSVLTVENRELAQDSLAGARSRLSTAWRSLDGRGRPESPWAFWVLVTCVVALTAIGLTMVLSASAVEQITKDLDPLSLFTKQLVWALIGLAGMFILSRFPLKAFMALGWPVYLLAFILLSLVAFTPLGYAVGGNTNWLRIGSVQIQPSEPAKLAIALWGGFLLKRKQRYLQEWKETALPVLIFGGLLIVLVMIGKDLGTSMILGIVLLTVLWAGETRGRLIALVIGVGVAGAALASKASGNRTNRISAWLFGQCDGGVCDQAQSGLTALARGGWIGRGLGQSQVKWSWLPEAHNDFVFAIIGEELGLLGTSLVVILFAVFGLVAMRVVLRYDDVFVRVAGSCIIVWITAQAALNIAMVVGLLPVIGVPLPFISYGGSALTVTMAAVGVLLSFARPEAPGGAARRRRLRLPFGSRERTTPHDD